MEELEGEWMGSGGVRDRKGRRGGHTMTLDPFQHYVVAKSQRVNYSLLICKVRKAACRNSDNLLECSTVINCAQVVMDLR